MGNEIANQLSLVRRACRDLRTEQPTVSERLTPIVDVLDRIIAELGPGNEARKATAAQLAELRGKGGCGDYEVEGILLGEELRALDAASKPDLARIAAAIETDRRLWQTCEDAIMAEIGRSHGDARATAEDESPSGSADDAALSAFINRAIPGEGGVAVTATKVASEGFSKKTLFVTLAGNRVLPQEIVLRMDKPFNFLGTTVLDEFSAIQLLYNSGAPVPRPYALEATGEVLGGPFLLSERLSGDIAGKSYFPPECNDRLLESFARALAAIHAIPITAGMKIGASLPDERPFIEIEFERYLATWVGLKAACPVIDAALVWIRSNLESGKGDLAIVHNDFDYHNVIVEGDEVSGVVDWEFVHIGHPAADLGYFQDSADRCGGIGRFVDAYVAAGGRRPSQDALDFYIVWGHVRLAIMSFQTEIAYRQGSFDDIRFALAGVYFLRKPILAVAEQLQRILARNEAEIAA